jgi:hypothetical protein
MISSRFYQLSAGFSFSLIAGPENTASTRRRRYIRQDEGAELVIEEIGEIGK